MVAFFVNSKSLCYFLSNIYAELAGRFAFFKWAMNYENGTFMYLAWALIYCACLFNYYQSINTYSKKQKSTIIFTIMLIAFQIIMAFDSYKGLINEEILYNNYIYITVFIHCCIVSSFIPWRNIIKRLDAFFVGIRRIFGDYGYLVVCWYNSHINQNKSA